jgi:hypothetical protein
MGKSVRTSIFTSETYFPWNGTSLVERFGFS